MNLPDVYRPRRPPSQMDPRHIDGSCAEHAEGKTRVGAIACLLCSVLSKTVVVGSHDLKLHGSAAQQMLEELA